jgi:hypothetical protein
MAGQGVKVYLQMVFATHKILRDVKATSLRDTHNRRENIFRTNSQIHVTLDCC